MAYFQNGNARVYYEGVGQGEPIIANHGPSTSTGYLGQGKYTGKYWPILEWKSCRPEAVGVNSEKLRLAIEGW